jgi:hypothetical protein
MALKMNFSHDLFGEITDGYVRIRDVIAINGSAVYVDVDYYKSKAIRDANPEFKLKTETVSFTMPDEYDNIIEGAYVGIKILAQFSEAQDC